MGGATKFVLDIAEQLGARGYRVTVATTGYDTEEPNPWLDKLLEITPDVFVLSHSRPVELPRLIVHLARARQCGRIVISHSMLGYQLLPWLRTELHDVTFLDYTHIEYETEQPNGGYALRSVNNQPLLDMSMVSSGHLRKWMIQKGADDAGLRVCHTNIDTDKWTPSAENRARDRDVLGAEPKTAVILYPCRLVDQKRPELMCNIVSALRRATKEPFTVIVAGDGPLMPALRKFIENHGLKDSFQLLGAVTLDRVARLHNASDILLLPSLIEGIALALFEAMALESVPVVADVGGQRELVSPDCGYLIAHGEAERELTDYVNALKRLIENPEERRQMGAASRERVQDHFRLSQMTSTFIATMEEASIRQKKRPVRLPDPSICQEMATLAIDQIRLTREGSTVQEMVYILQDQAAKQERVAAKLRRQIETIRSIKPVQEENEVRY
jgi:glycosyltransferase involved in cell wall biosynthesis